MSSALVAQGIEHGSPKAGVAGSNPAGGTHLTADCRHLVKATIGTGPVPTVDQVVAIMSELTDPNIPAVNKSNVITPALHC